MSNAEIAVGSVLDTKEKEKINSDIENLTKKLNNSFIFRNVYKIEEIKKLGFVNTKRRWYKFLHNVTNRIAWVCNTGDISWGLDKIFYDNSVKKNSANNTLTTDKWVVSYNKEDVGQDEAIDAADGIVYQMTGFRYKSLSGDKPISIIEVMTEVKDMKVPQYMLKIKGENKNKGELILTLSELERKLSLKSSEYFFRKKSKSKKSKSKKSKSKKSKSKKSKSKKSPRYYF
jgi:hypothetical protein